MYPNARSAGLIVENLTNETVIYDTTVNSVHCLNQTASFIWRHCDGGTSEEQLAGLLSQSLDAPADLDVVRMGLLELSNRGLLTGEIDTPRSSRPHTTRRAALLSGALAALLPVISSITAPTPAMATSQDNHGNGNGNGNGNGPKKRH